MEVRESECAEWQGVEWCPPISAAAEPLSSRPQCEERGKERQGEHRQAGSADATTRSTLHMQALWVPGSGQISQKWVNHRKRTISPPCSKIETAPKWPVCAGSWKAGCGLEVKRVKRYKEQISPLPIGPDVCFLSSSRPRKRSWRSPPWCCRPVQSSPVNKTLLSLYLSF